MGATSSKDLHDSGLTRPNVPAEATPYLARPVDKVDVIETEAVEARFEPSGVYSGPHEAHRKYVVEPHRLHQLLAATSDYQVARPARPSPGYLPRLRGQRAEPAQVFDEMAAAWRRERGPLSSPRQMAMHPAYQRIIGMGPAALPLILRELERRPDHWFWALQAITGADPVPVGARGNMRDMAAAWLAWGKENGLAW